MVTGVVPSPPWSLPSSFIAHRVQQSRCSSIFHRVLLTHALALSPRQFVHKKKFPRIYTSMNSSGLELTKLTYTRLEDNLIRHRGDRHHDTAGQQFWIQPVRLYLLGLRGWMQARPIKIARPAIDSAQARIKLSELDTTYMYKNTWQCGEAEA